MNHRSSYVKGKDVISEDLREKCLYQNLKNKKDYWKYMERAHDLCVGSIITEECSKIAHQYIQQSFDETNLCVKNSFMAKDNFQSDNKILFRESIDWNKYGSGFYPAVVVNNRTLKGDITPDMIMRDLCAAYS